MTNRRPGSVLLFVLLLSGMVLSQFEPAEAQVDAAALSRAMKSVAELIAETKDGKESRGLSFLTAGGGRAVTAAHLIKNASKVTLRFQDGTELLSPGIIAVDEKRSLAMIEVPASGREGLTLVQTSISPGTTVHCGAVRDGTYGFVQLSVSEVHQGAAGVERYVLSGEAPSGNSGSPALDQKGNVTGVVIETTEGRLLVPSAFVAAIDASSPLKSWGGEVPETVDAPQADTGPGPMDEIEKALLDFLVILYDHDSIYRWASQRCQTYTIDEFDLGEDRTLSSRRLAASGDASFIATTNVSIHDFIFSPKRAWIPLSGVLPSGPGLLVLSIV